MLIETANETFTPMQFAVVVTFIVYFSNTVLLSTSFGLRLGYHPYRKLLVAPVWPLLLSKRVNEWAQYDPDNPPKCVYGYLKLVDERVN